VVSTAYFFVLHPTVNLRWHNTDGALQPLLLRVSRSGNMRILMTYSSCLPVFGLISLASAWRVVVLFSILDDELTTDLDWDTYPLIIYDARWQLRTLPCFCPLLPFHFMAIFFLIFFTNFLLILCALLGIWWWCRVYYHSVSRERRWRDECRVKASYGVGVRSRLPGSLISCSFVSIMFWRSIQRLIYYSASERGHFTGRTHSRCLPYPPVASPQR